jgi:DNA topoisomerase-1
MSKNLVIVESPTKAKTIGKYLGPEYRVEASVGHIRDLATRAGEHDKLVPGVEIDDGFKPRYETISRAAKQIATLKKLAKEAPEVYFATDLDREGEAIAWHLAEILGIPTERAKRVVFNQVTAAALAEAFEHPRAIEQNRVDAQQARRILDRIVGYRLSPLLWARVGGGLSAGRVQSVATRLVVEREREIEQFEPDESWRIAAVMTVDPAAAAKIGDDWRTFIGADPERSGEKRTVDERNTWMSEHAALQADLKKFDGRKFEPDNRTDALAVAEAMGFALEDTKTVEDPKGKGAAKNKCFYAGSIAQGAPEYRIVDLSTTSSTSKPDGPFITSTLQRAAANRYGFDLRRTMRVAQQLYEGIDLGGSRGLTGLITYMRTDSRHLAPEAVASARTYIKKACGADYLPDKPANYAGKNTNAQEAHEAIRPTDVGIAPDDIRARLSSDQQKIYDLVWRQFVACQMTPARWENTKLKIEAKTPEGKAELEASGRRLVFDGFLKIRGRATGGDVVLPQLEQGKQLGLAHVSPTQHFESPPPRYNEASLQKVLEDKGIGRPSTYASIISTIQDRKYVEPVVLGDRRLRATDLGKVVTDKLVESFSRVLDINYTSEMETELDEIESGSKNWQQMLEEFYGPFEKDVERAHETMTHARAEMQPAPDHKCPECGSDCCYRFGKNGRFLSCTAYDVPPAEVVPEGHKDTYLLYKAKGKARPKLIKKDAADKLGWRSLTKDDQAKFQKLSDEMPERCKYAAPIDSEGNPIVPKLTDIICPEDGEQMQLRTGRFGPFLSSPNYPDVKFVLNLDPKKGFVKLPKTPPITLEDEECPKCKAPLYLREGKRGLWLACSTFPKCRARPSMKDFDAKHKEALQKAWDKHQVENPAPQIKTKDGKLLTDDDKYVPQIVGEIPAGG